MRGGRPPSFGRPAPFHRHALAGPFEWHRLQILVIRMLAEVIRVIRKDDRRSCAEGARFLSFVYRSTSTPKPHVGATTTIRAKVFS